MKNLFFLSIVFIRLSVCPVSSVFSQGVKISANPGAPDASAIVEMESNTKGFLPPRMTTAERNAIANPANGLTIMNTTMGCLEYYNNGQWHSLCGTNSTWSCGSTLTISHVAGSNGAPETKTVNYGTVLTAIGGTGSKCWITQNLGASNQASSVTDNSTAAAGWYWLFNRLQGYMVGPIPAWTTTSINENSDWTPANDPCTLELGAGWRIPTYAELTNADAAWGNYNDTYNSVLKLHAAGYLSPSDGSQAYCGSIGYCWTSAQIDNFSGYDPRFDGGSSVIDYNSKAYGFSVRCIKD